MLLLEFDITATVLILLFLVPALFARRKETIVRALTILGLLQLFSAAMWIGPIAVGVLMVTLWALAIEELRRAYALRPIPFPLIAAAGLVLFFSYRAALMPWVLIGSLIVGVMAFSAPGAWIKHAVFAGFFALFVVNVGVVMSRELFVLDPGAMMAMFLLLSCNDSFGYFVGKRFGRIKPFPRLSPGKSLEGYLGGVVGTALALVLLHTTAPALAGAGVGKTVLMGLFVILFSNGGDLLFSALKRGRGTKDFSSLLPGHGGVLDRFDSILFTAPFLYWLWVALRISS